MSEAKKILIKKPIILRRKKSVTEASHLCINELQYQNKNCNANLFCGKYENLNIVNNYNTAKKTLQTVATYKANSRNVILSSNELSNTIGNDKYQLLLKALNCVSDEKLKIEAILALLTPKRGAKVDKCCQTLETKMNRNVPKRGKIRQKRLQAYVIDKPVNDEATIECDKNPKESVSKVTEPIANDELIDLRLLLDEESNLSSATDGNISLRSCHIPNIPVLLENPIALLNGNNTKDVVTNNITLKLVDGGTVLLRQKPEDFFHIATPEILENLSVEDKKRVLLHQAYIDWKYCLECDAEGNLPIHIAATTNDFGLLKRHCAMLKSRNESLDLTGKESMSALQLSIVCNSPASVALLLRSGADVLQRDDNARSVLHLAGDSSVECLDVILDFCRANARKIMLDEEELWQPEFEKKTDDELGQYLLDHLCCLFDDNGCTALMSCCQRGRHAEAAALARASPRSVSARRPTAGDSALYLACQAAFIDAQQTGSKTIIAQNYLEIIEMLQEYGADPTATNDSGHSVAMLTAEFKINELSQAVASKLLKVTSAQKNFDSYMLVKDKKGGINVELVTPGKKDKNVKVSLKDGNTAIKDREIVDKVVVNERNMSDDDKKLVKKTVVFFKPTGNSRKEILPAQNIESEFPKDKPINVQIVNKNDQSVKQNIVLPANVKLHNINVASLSKNVPINVTKVINKQIQAKNIVCSPIKINNLPIKLNLNKSVVKNVSLTQSSIKITKPDSMTFLKSNSINKEANDTNSSIVSKTVVNENLKMADFKRPKSCQLENAKRPRK